MNNQSIIAPLNANMTPGIYECFIHVYCPVAGADNSLGTSLF